MKQIMDRIRAELSPAFELVYLTCVFFMYFEIAVPLPYSVFKGLYAGVFLLLTLRIVLLRERPWDWVPAYLRSSRALVPVLLMLAYLLWDVAGLWYSPNPSFAAKKYLVILPMLLFLIPTFYYIRSETRLNKLYMTLAFSGISVGLFSLSNYFVYEFIPLPYIRRLSFLADYNRYAQCLFIPFALGCFGIANTRFKNRHTRTALLFACAAYYALIITLSGSRRTYLALFPAIGILLLYRAFLVARYSVSEKTAFRRLAAGAVLCVLCAAGVYLGQLGFERYSDIKYRSELENGGNVGQENTVEEVIDTISSGGLFDKRLVIWRVAVNEALNYELKDILIGRGSGYDVYLYDITDDKTLAKLYSGFNNKPKNWMSPHNFLLADLLSGGVIRVTISLALVLALISLLFRLFVRRPGRALPLMLAMGFVYFYALISGHYGYAYDKYFYILLAAIVAEHALSLSQGHDGSRARL